mgnify:CR=1 FL=1|jgi:hypothetical protein
MLGRRVWDAEPFSSAVVPLYDKSLRRSILRKCPREASVQTSLSVRRLPCPSKLSFTDSSEGGTKTQNSSSIILPTSWAPFTGERLAADPLAEARGR